MQLRRAKHIFSILLIVCFLLTGLVPSAFASITAKVNTSSARAYKSASTRAVNVKVPKALEVSITDISGSWAKISYKGVTAYMPVKALTPSEKAKAYIKEAVSAYSTSGKKLGTLPKGTAIYVLGSLNGNALIANGAGAVAIVKSSAITADKPSTAEGGSSGASPKITTETRIDLAIKLGESLLGRPYARNADPPESFNCSAFVKYCLGKVGYSMKNTAATQAADDRYQLISSLSNVQRGDILFFDTSEDGAIDHSVIYMGDGRFIEASQSAGKVQTNTLTSWYKKHFKWARRVA